MVTLTNREKRVIVAFINCIKTGEYSESYAILLLEDESRYGWLSDTAKEYFYEELDKLHPAQEPEPAPEEETEESESVG